MADCESDLYFQIHCMNSGYHWYPMEWPSYWAHQSCPLKTGLMQLDSCQGRQRFYTAGQHTLILLPHRDTAQ